MQCCYDSNLFSTNYICISFSYFSISKYIILPHSLQVDSKITLFDDHQFFTNYGFLSGGDVRRLLDERDRRLLDKQDPGLKLAIAAYDHSLKSFSWIENFTVEENPTTEHEVVEFTNKKEGERWGEGSDPKGRYPQSTKDEPDSSYSNGISFRVAREQCLLVKCGKMRKRVGGRGDRLRIAPSTDAAGFVPVKAMNLATPKTGFKILCYAENGISQKQGENRMAFRMVCIALGLTTEEQKDGFLDFHGFFNGDGSLELVDKNGREKVPDPNKPTEKKPSAVSFNIWKKPDVTWMRKLLNLLGLARETAEYKLKKSAKRIAAGTKNSDGVKFLVKSVDWVTHFFNEYGWKYSGYVSPFHDDDKKFVGISTERGSNMKSEKIPSAKWVPYWLWTLPKERIRVWLEGLRRADGSWKKDRNDIYTSSYRFRDEIVRLLIMAGYAPRFHMRKEAGEVIVNKTGELQGVEINVNHDTHVITYPEDKKEPHVVADTDVKLTNYVGKSCTIVIPGGVDGIFIRRAEIVGPRCEIYPLGKVLKASIPVIACGRSAMGEC